MSLPWICSRNKTQTKILSTFATESLRTKVFIAEVRSLIDEYGPNRIFFDMESFPRCDSGAAWLDLKFACEHLDDVERLVIVGDENSESWLATLRQPFTKAEVRFYKRSEADAARVWIEEQ